MLGIGDIVRLRAPMQRAAAIDSLSPSALSVSQYTALASATLWGPLELQSLCKKAIDLLADQHWQADSYTGYRSYASDQQVLLVFARSVKELQSAAESEHLLWIWNYLSDCSWRIHKYLAAFERMFAILLEHGFFVSEIEFMHPFTSESECQCVHYASILVFSLVRSHSQFFKSSIRMLLQSSGLEELKSWKLLVTRFRSCRRGSQLDLNLKLVSFTDMYSIMLFRFPESFLSVTEKINHERLKLIIFLLSAMESDLRIDTGTAVFESALDDLSRRISDFSQLDPNVSIANSIVLGIKNKHISSQRRSLPKEIAMTSSNSFQRTDSEEHCSLENTLLLSLRNISNSQSSEGQKLLSVIEAEKKRLKFVVVNFAFLMQINESMRSSIVKECPSIKELLTIYYFRSTFVHIPKENIQYDPDFMTSHVALMSSFKLMHCLTTAVASKSSNFCSIIAIFQILFLSLPHEQKFLQIVLLFYSKLPKLIVLSKCKYSVGFFEILLKNESVSGSIDPKHSDIIFQIACLIFQPSFDSFFGSLDEFVRRLYTAFSITPSEKCLLAFADQLKIMHGEFALNSLTNLKYFASILNFPRLSKYFHLQKESSFTSEWIENIRIGLPLAEEQLRHLKFQPQCFTLISSCNSENLLTLFGRMRFAKNSFCKEAIEYLCDHDHIVDLLAQNSSASKLLSIFERYLIDSNDTFIPLALISRFCERLEKFLEQSSCVSISERLNHYANLTALFCKNINEENFYRVLDSLTRMNVVDKGDFVLLLNVYEILLEHLPMVTFVTSEATLWKALFEGFNDLLTIAVKKFLEKSAGFPILKARVKSFVSMVIQEKGVHWKIKRMLFSFQ